MVVFDIEEPLAVGDVVVNIRGTAHADFIVPEKHLVTAGGESMTDIRMVQRKKDVDVRKWWLVGGGGGVWVCL